MGSGDRPSEAWLGAGQTPTRESTELAPMARADEGSYSSRSWVTADLVADLRAAGAGPTEPGRSLRRKVLPSRDALARIATALRAAFFPMHFGDSEAILDGLDDFVRNTLEGSLLALHKQVTRGLHFACDHGQLECPECGRRADEVLHRFARALPSIRGLLELDVRSAFEGDPAATSPDEAVLCYPGVTAILHHRIAHELYALGVPLVPRMISEIAHAATGIDIHPGAQIGGSFFIDHGTGVVVGETCLVGDRVRLYQSVTLGAKTFPVDPSGRPIKGNARHPVVEDDVVIYAGATILGRITIGRGSTIGGNVWLTRSVAPNSRVTQGFAKTEHFESGSGR
jgi:serine O-acetyltransferase